MNCHSPMRLLLAAALLALATATLAATPEAAAGGARPADGGRVTLDFAGAEIDAVARTMATLTGRNVVVDPRVKGTINLTSTVPVAPAQALQLFAAQLRIQGFALIDSNGIVLVLPESDAKLQSGAVSAGAIKGGGQIQTQIFRLTHENASNLVAVLRPLISPNNTINVNPGTNALVITDYGDNLQRLARIIAALDVAHATGVEVVPLRHAVALDLAPLLARLLESGGSGTTTAPRAGSPPGQPPQPASAAGGDGNGYPTTVLPEPRTNALILRAANPARLALARALIEQLDQPPAPRREGSSGSNIHVVYLKNAEAAKLAVTLRAALAALPEQAAGTVGGTAGVAAAGAGSAPRNTALTATGSNAPGASGAGGSGASLGAAGANMPSTGGQIQADPATNSLIISAPEPVYRDLRAVIDKLDQRRAQVYVESLIAEVRLDKAAEFGIQWQSLLGRRDGNNVGIIGTNYGQGGDNLLSLLGQFIGGMPAPQNLLVPPQGLNIGVGHRVGNLFTLGALANFLQTTGTGNVLSTPTLLTLDNEEARIIVGRNVPFVTGSYTNTGASSTSVNPFQTYERKDVGLTLQVRPQISENGTVKMAIYQEASSIEPTSIGSPQGLITNKRAIESSVLVEDGAIVVLGGLMEDQYTEGEDKVPGLGDIPLVGNLFRNRSRSYVKTNLMVFLRPVVVRDGAATEAFSIGRYDLLRGAQGANQPAPSSVLQINQGPVLPPAIANNPDAWRRPAPPPLIQPPIERSPALGAPLPPDAEVYRY